MKGRWYGIFTSILLLASAVAALWFYFRWTGAMQENARLSQVRQELEKRAEELGRECDYKNRYYNKLVSDDEFASRVIREKLGYAYPDDIVFRFKDSQPVSIDDDGEAPAPAPKKDESFWSSALVKLGLKSKTAPEAGPETEDPQKKQTPAAPELRIDMTGASIAALERKAAIERANAPTLSFDSSAALSAQLPPPAPDGEKLLCDAGQNLVEAKMKPVKVRLGSTTALSYTPKLPPKPVRFSSR